LFFFFFFLVPGVLVCRGGVCILPPPFSRARPFPVTPAAATTRPTACMGHAIKAEGVREATGGREAGAGRQSLGSSAPPACPRARPPTLSPQRGDTRRLRHAHVGALPPRQWPRRPNLSRCDPFLLPFPGWRGRAGRARPTAGWPLACRRMRRSRDSSARAHPRAPAPTDRRTSGTPARPGTRPARPHSPPLGRLDSLADSPVTAHRARAAMMKEKRMVFFLSFFSVERVRPAFFFALRKSGAMRGGGECPSRSLALARCEGS